MSRFLRKLLRWLLAAVVLVLVGMYISPVEEKCPQTVSYEPALLNQLKIELDEIPDYAVIKRVLIDYTVMRKQTFKCWGIPIPEEENIPSNSSPVSGEVFSFFIRCYNIS